jgi:plasmid rolling circle replication initiator protein Rep
LSETSDGQIVSAPILASNRQEGKDANNPALSDAPALSDLSERDKPWDKHRTNCDATAVYYKGSEFNQYAERMNECSGLLDFRLVPEAKDGVYRLKLATARFCKVRHCPVCQWRRSLMWKAKAYKILPQVLEDYPNYRWLFVTLTVRNCAVTELRETLTWMNKGFKRLSELKAFPAVGYIKTTEVTRGKTPPGSAHPHFHVLMLVKPSYFGVNYLSQTKWVAMWGKSLRVDYKPILDVQALKPNDSLVGLLAEVIKYSVKESDLTTDREWFLELTRQLHRTKAIAVGGVLRDYLRELECEPEDLIGNTNEGEVDEGHLYFGWRSKEKKYRLNNS